MIENICQKGNKSLHLITTLIIYSTIFLNIVIVYIKNKQPPYTNKIVLHDKTGYKNDRIQAVFLKKWLHPRIV